MKNLNLKGELFLILVLLLGISLAAYSFIHEGIYSWVELMAFTLMAALIGPATVKIGTKIEMTPAFLFSFCALLLYGISGALIVAIASTLSSCFLRKKRLSTAKILFNLSSITIAMFASGLTLNLISEGNYQLTNQSFLGAVLLATFVFYLTNAFLVTAIVALTEIKSFFSIWNEKFIWTAPSYFAGSSFAVGIAFLISYFGISIVVLTLPPSALIYYFYRFYLNRGEERKKLILTIKQLMESEESLRKQHQELLEEIDQLKKFDRVMDKASVKQMK